MDIDYTKPKKLDDMLSNILFLSIGEGAIVIDEKARISRINKVALDVLGYDEKELLGKWYPQVVVAEDEDGNIIPNIKRPTTEVFIEGNSVFKRLFYRKKSGERVPVAVTASAIMQKDKPLGAIEIFRDITEEFQLERAKDEFITIASHQLRTPATVVKQYLGMIIEGHVTEPDHINKLINVAYKHNDFQLDIINKLLNVAQAEAKKVKIQYSKTNIIELIENVMLGQKPSYEQKNMKMELNSTEKVIKCDIDILHMQMVFENILNNANKYSNDGTKVVISIFSTPASVKIDFADEGIGIRKKDLSKLFKKFSRAESVINTDNGNGLGLYWAKKLIELHKGKISVKSILGKGTTFTIVIPREQIV